MLLFVDDMRTDIEHRIALDLNDILIVIEKENERSNIDQKSMSMMIQLDDQTEPTNFITYQEHWPTVKLIQSSCWQMEIWVEVNDDMYYQ